MSALLAIENLVVRFSAPGGLLSRVSGKAQAIEAVAGVSLEVEAGRTYALVGESGSGKTTLARAVIGLAPVSSGRIVFEGREITARSDRDLRPLRREVATMFQDPVGSLSPRRSVRSILSEPFRVHGVKADLAQEVPRLLSQVGLPADFAERYPHQLSGGQARRVGVARALALRPKLVIADEPTAGLDVSVQGELLNLMNRLQAELGIAFLMITHNLHVVRHVADRMGVLYLGRLVEEGRTADIFGQPRHRYTEALLSANPEPDPDFVGHRIPIRGEVPSLLARPAGCEFHPRCGFAVAPCPTVAPERTLVGQAHSFTCHNPQGA
ncbi:MAG: peptide ABC transporter ATP-binding protein [Mesorhizobium amorphae]|nr:MAG: peptide ABC transporter ATP-binding protein [Mesorhizobium amorphae]